MNDELLFQYYLVVFLDHLGQKNALRKINSLPNNISEEEFISNLEKSYGKVAKLRRDFKEYFDASASFNPNLDLVHPENQEELLESQKTEISFYGISDSVIIFVPLINNNYYCTAINSVFSALMATCQLGLLSLSKNTILRAGIDIGIACEISKNEIYGPALERAYYLESRMAEYPRFVIGDEAVKYIYGVKNQKCNSQLGKIAQNMANISKEMIIKDTDGRLMLDFLGRKVKEYAGEVIEKEIVQHAYENVIKQFDTFKAAGNDKMSARYYRLLKYFDSRLKIWDI